MASSSEQSFTKTLVGDINIPDDLLYDGKTSKERQTENQKLVSAMVKKLLKDKLQNNDGILELENDFLYILSLNAIIPKPSQQHLLWARHSNLPCNPDSIERGFKKYADFLPNMSCCPLQMQDICDVQKALKNLLPEKITAFACLDKKGDWGYEFLTFGNELHFAYFEQYDFKVVFIPKFPLSEKNKSDLSSLLGALLQNDLAPLDKSLSEHFNQLKNAQIVSPGAKPDLAVLKEKLINCDLTRFGLDSYDAKILTDVDRGHWDLWNLDAKQEDTTTVSIPTGQWLVARDPVADILNGVVAIDFGTKSTVVVRMEESGIPQPMRIGLGNLRKAATVKDYENPTVLEFRDYAGFRKAYKAKAGRPCTRMDQITISHSAANALLESAAEDYHAYLAELKQWAGDKTRTLCIMDKKNKLVLMFH